MTDPKKPQDVNDLRSRLGLGAAGGSSSPAPDASPPAPSFSPPGGGPAVPPPALGGGPPGSGAVPPPVLVGSGGVPAPLFGQKKVDVAPPPFAAKKKKKRIRKIVQEEYEVEDVVDDPRARAARRKVTIVCVILAIPLLGSGFYYGKSRQDWALMDRSRQDASSLAQKLTEGTALLDQVKTRTAAALAKSQSFEVDEGYVEFTRETSERPVQAGDVDMLNYAAFTPETVDRVFELARLVDDVWSKMASHRNQTKADLGALQKAREMGDPMNPRFGVVLMNLDQETYGASVGVIGNPGEDDDGNATLDLQVRAGRRSQSYKVYTRGSFGDKATDWVVPIDPAQTAKGGALSKADKSHMARYVERLTELNAAAARASELNAELIRELQGLGG